MAATAEATEGAVLTLITKRLRNLRKKHKRILQLEEGISQGKTLDKDQEEVLRSKSSVLTLIDEYEKLRQPLSTALQEELQLQQNQKPPVPVHQEPPPVVVDTEPVVEDLLKLLYFGSLFDVKPQSDFTSTMLTRTHERGCCLTYDYVTDDATDLLGEKDLDMISFLGSLVVSRPGNSSLSHKNTLRTCLQHAKAWLANSQQPIDEGTDVTYAALRERLNKILASDYYTTSPEIKAGEVAAAAAAGNYAPSTTHVPVQGSSASSEITVQTESDYAAYEEKDEETEHSEGQETGVDQSGTVDEFPKESETQTAVDGNSIQQDNKPEGDIEEQNHRDVDSKDQQHNSRRGYQNHRGGSRGGGGGGGRRGGYPNGRGGRGGRGGSGGYQNGRSQYYEQSANYYPRNYYNPRGGRGGGRGAGGNNGYSNRGGHAQADEVHS